MIITLSECKSLLQITGSTSDELIKANIPIVEQAIVDYCNNDFILRQFDPILSSAISFNSSDNSINLTNIGNKKLVANDTIRVYNSLRNDAVYTIDSVETNKLIINDINTLIDELSSENETVYIAKIKYPIPLRFLAAQMIKFNLQKFTHGYIKETVDDHSWELDPNMSNGYPKNLMSGLKSYRLVFKPGIVEATTRGL